jgi:hypothetical protein
VPLEVSWICPVSAVVTDRIAIPIATTIIGRAQPGRRRRPRVGAGGVRGSATAVTTPPR